MGELRRHRGNRGLECFEGRKPAGFGRGHAQRQRLHAGRHGAREGPRRRGEAQPGRQRLAVRLGRRVGQCLVLRIDERVGGDNEADPGALEPRLRDGLIDDRRRAWAAEVRSLPDIHLGKFVGKLRKRNWTRVVEPPRIEQLHRRRAVHRGQVLEHVGVAVVEAVAHIVVAGVHDDQVVGRGVGLQLRQRQRGRGHPVRRIPREFLERDDRVAAVGDRVVAAAERGHGLFQHLDPDFLLPVDDVLPAAVDGVAGEAVAHGDRGRREAGRAEGRQAAGSVQVKRDRLGPVGVGADHVADRARIEQRDLADRGQQEAVAHLSLVDVVDGDRCAVVRLLEVKSLRERGRHDDRRGGGRDACNVGVVGLVGSGRQTMAVRFRGGDANWLPRVCGRAAGHRSLAVAREFFGGL